MSSRITESMVDAALRGEFDYRQRERSLGSMFVPTDRAIVRAMLEAALATIPDQDAPAKVATSRIVTAKRPRR
jgi:hypothetical protein